MTSPRFSEATRSGTRALQVLIAGSIIDRVSQGAPLSQASVRLLTSATGEVYPLLSKVAEDGSFAFYGSPVRAFPPSPEPYQLQIEVSSPLYQTKTHDVDFTITSFPDPVTRMEELSDVAPVLIELFPEPPVGPNLLPLKNILIELEPIPVRLRGRVVDAVQPAIGIKYALVEIVDHPAYTTKTGPNGLWSFDESLPVLAQVSVRVAHVTLFPHLYPVTEIWLDYSRRINTVVIAV